MPSTAFNGFPYPALSSQPNVPQDMQNLAQQVELKMPRGRLPGFPLVRSSQAGPITSSAGLVVVSGLTATITLSTARKLDLIFAGQATSQTVGTIVGIQIWNATTAGGVAQTVQIPVANYGQPLAVFVSDTLAAGTYTYNIRLYQSGGTGDAYLTAVPAVFTINDMGAA